MAEPADVAAVRRWLADGGEIAFLDVREEGQHGAGHPLLAVNLPYSRLELDVRRLVPRLACRIVLVDDGDGVAERAARRLAAIGYTSVHILAGGVAAWEDAGHRLFPSINVPSKGFAEIVEHDSRTPHIGAAELDRRRRAGEKLVVLDSRTVEEFNRFHVPGAITCPGAELVLRFADLVPDPDTLVVVSCAGRTRSIIGAQSLINAGVPNRVVSLSGGTQGWRLSGLDLERDTRDSLRPVSAAAVAAARPRAERVARRFGVRTIDRNTLAAWQGDAQRTTCLLDVRTPEEYAAGHLAGSVSAPGGQLVQAIDRWVGTRGARLVLIDDTGVRAVMTAHWLQQMGWDVQVLDRALESATLVRGEAEEGPAELPALDPIEPDEAARWLAAGAAAVCLGSSAAYRRQHPQDAVWAIRPRLGQLPHSALAARRLVLFADDEDIARCAAIDLREYSTATIAAARGGAAAWLAAGLPAASTPDDPPDEACIDYVFWNHDRHAGNETAMLAYLTWETELPAQIAAERLSGFRLAAG
ncbi:MAG TPA: rhodanese-like domain-containing protein [Stellaceae bacterium]|nr:rhodanese-like domain-containing protein [Stellaceae bacterium]